MRGRRTLLILQLATAAGSLGSSRAWAAEERRGWALTAAMSSAGREAELWRARLDQAGIRALVWVQTGTLQSASFPEVGIDYAQVVVVVVQCPPNPPRSPSAGPLGNFYSALPALGPGWGLNDVPVLARAGPLGVSAVEFWQHGVPVRVLGYDPYPGGPLDQELEAGPLISFLAFPAVEGEGTQVPRTDHTAGPARQSRPRPGGSGGQPR